MRIKNRVRERTLNRVSQAIKSAPFGEGDNLDLAIEHLRKAAQRETFDPNWAWEDPDLQWIRDDPRFVEIVGPKPQA